MTTDLDRALAAVVASLAASTVRVHDERGRGSGSGVVWRADGLIVTNAHVVRGRSAEVELSGRGRVRAEIVRRDDRRDLAALRVGEAGLVAAAVRDAPALQPGELVVAVGNPLGLRDVATAGLVQRAGGRFVVADVRLAPGNSGGPLADAAGRVVGINSMVANGSGYAVPSQAVATFLGERVRARLGVAAARVVVDAGVRRLPALLVTAVERGSAAERAGIALGDVILGSDAGPVGDAEAFAASLASAAWLDVLRGGRSLRVGLPVEDARAA